MAKIFTRKGEVTDQLTPCLEAYNSSGIKAAAELCNDRLLTQKIKFPLLEYCAREFIQTIQASDQIAFCDLIETYKTIGGHVLLGIILRNRLADYYEESLFKAKEYISKTDSWHACDTIGERVFGWSMLHTPKKTLPELKRIANHENQWVARSAGAGMHNAIYNGLAAEHVERLFQILLSLGNSKNKEIKQGVGWAAKTTAKFHPEIIKKHRTAIDDVAAVGQWFRTKVKIGLARNEYAKRN